MVDRSVVSRAARGLLAGTVVARGALALGVMASILVIANGLTTEQAGITTPEALPFVESDVVGSSLPEDDDLSPQSVPEPAASEIGAGGEIPAVGAQNDASQPQPDAPSRPNPSTTFTVSEATTATDSTATALGPTTTLRSNTTRQTASSATPSAPAVAPSTTTTRPSTTIATSRPTTATTAGPSTTAAPSPSATLMALGDIGICGSPDPATVAALAAGRSGPIIALGDIAYPSGSATDFSECFAQPYAQVLNRLIPVIGNHEYETADGQGWKDFFGRTDTYYTQQLSSGWLLVVVDTECNLIGGCGANDPQQRWLSQTLADAPSCVVLAMHRPYRTSYTDYDRESRSQTIHSIAQGAGVDVILTGHAHMYERVRFGTMQQFTVGTGGAGLRPAGSPIEGSESIVLEHGVLELGLQAAGYEWKFLNTESSIRDSGTASCS